MIIVITFTNPSSAHHGKDFLFSQSAILPHPAEFYIIPKVDIINHNGEYETEFEPGFLVGITDWFALELHGHLSNEGHGSSLSYEATAPAVHIGLSPENSSLNFGLSMEYEISHNHHHPNNFESRLSASQTFDFSMVALNLIFEKFSELNSTFEWSYSAGYKKNLNNQLDLGIEIQGSFELEEGEVIGVLFYNPKNQVDFSFGFGTGLGSNIHFSIHTSLIWQLDL